MHNKLVLMYVWVEDRSFQICLRYVFKIEKKVSAYKGHPTPMSLYSTSMTKIVVKIAFSLGYRYNLMKTVLKVVTLLDHRVLDFKDLCLD